MSRTGRKLERELQRQLRELERTRSVVLPGTRALADYPVDQVEQVLDRFRPWLSGTDPGASELDTDVST